MESKVLVYCAVAATLGIIAAATGFAGEATKVKASKVQVVLDTCVYPGSPALALGIVSAAFTMITRTYISVTFGEAGCCRNDPNSTRTSKLLYLFSWLATVVAMFLFLGGSILNKEGAYVAGVDSDGSISCYVVKSGIFAGGAILVLLSTIFGIAAFIMLSQPPQNTTNQTTFRMGVNVDPEKSSVPFSRLRYPPQQD